MNAIQFAKSSAAKMGQFAQQARQEIKNAPRTYTELCVGLSIALATSSAQANVAPTLKFDGLKGLLESLVTFIAGPFGKAAVIVSIVAAFITWVFAPREGIFGPVLRVVVAGVAVMNAGLWVAQLGDGKVTL
jgi:type IV secretory pathway VirB2 component (pilin)